MKIINLRYKKLFFYFFFTIKIKPRCVCYNINKFNIEESKDNKKTTNTHEYLPSPQNNLKDKEDKKYSEENDIYSKNNGTSPFKWYNVNCVLKSTITEFNNLCNYIPEIIERIKDENNIIKDNINIDIKKRIINEILNQRQQYLELKRGIDVDKFLDLIVKYIEITIKTIPIEDLYQQKYKDLISFFANMFDSNSMCEDNLSKYLCQIYIFSEINKKSREDIKKQELENFKKIRNNIDLKNHDNKTGIDLYQFFYFINNYII